MEGSMLYNTESLPGDHNSVWVLKWALRLCKSSVLVSFIAVLLSEPEPLLPPVDTMETLPKLPTQKLWLIVFEFEKCDGFRALLDAWA